MLPIEIAKQMYKDHVEHDTFESAIARYLSISQGAVISTPKLFVMAAAMNYDGRHAWYIDTAVGNLKELIKVFPFKLPYIAFNRSKKNRNDKLRIYRLERFLRLI